MRKKFLFSYLYILVLSILSRPSSCRARTVESTPSPVNDQNIGNDGQQAAQQQQVEPTSDQKVAHSIQRRQLNNKQIQRGAYLLPIRRKRDFEDDSLSGRYQHPSNNLNPISGELRFKKSEDGQEEEADEDPAAPPGNFQPLKSDSKLNSNKGLLSNSIYDDKSLSQIDQDDNLDKLSDDALRAVNLYGVHPNPVLGLQSENSLRSNPLMSDTNFPLSGLKGKRDTQNVEHDQKSPFGTAEYTNEKSELKEDKRHTDKSKESSEKYDAALGKNNDALVSEKQKNAIQDNGENNLADDTSKLQKRENDDAAIAGQMGDTELDRSAEYEDETEEERLSPSEREAGYKGNNADPSVISAEESDKVEINQTAPDEEVDAKEVVKRYADGEEEYEEGEDQDSMSGEAYLVDSSNIEQGDARQELALTNKKDKREDVRVKRDEGDKSSIAKETTQKKGESTAEDNNRNENSVHSENNKDEGNDGSKREAVSDLKAKANENERNVNSKRDVSPDKEDRSDKEANNDNIKRAIGPDSEAKIEKEENTDIMKREVVPNAEAKADKDDGNENLKREVKADMEIKADKEEGNGNSQRVVRSDTKIVNEESSENLKREARSDTKPANEEGSENSKNEVRLDSKVVNEEGSENYKNEVKVEGGESKVDKQEINESSKREAKPATETKTEKQAGTDNLKPDVKLDMEAKDDESDADYEKRVEQQIQQKIDSIKEEIKREVEQKQKIQEIEENNAKYDELQTREDEDEESQSLEVPNQSVSKRSVQQNSQKPMRRNKRHILNRVKRSGSTNVRQLNEIERVDNLDPGVYERARLRHESIRKRSAPVYGDTDKETDYLLKPPIKKRSVPKKVTLVYNIQKRNARKRSARSAIIIPEQAYAKIEDDLPSDLALDPNLRLDSSGNDKNRVKRNLERYERHRRANAVVPEGRVSFLGYRPQDDDENDEGNEFDDDGFEDQTSNLQGKSYADPYSGQVQYQEDDGKGEDPSNFLFANRDQNGYLVRRKRAGAGAADFGDDGQPSPGQQVAFHGGGALIHHQAQLKAKRMQTARIQTSPDTDIERNKRSLEPVGGSKSDYVASLVDSSQELTPQLATEYREAFGGLQSDPGGALARFKRVKRVLHVS